MPNPRVVFQKLDDGAVLFSPDTELYFGLNEVGALVWQLLPPASASLPALTATVGARYPEVASSTIATDVGELLDALVREGLAIAPGADAGTAA
ncbi:MAG: PqqD family protein [Gemmatimonadaceae bacterium]|nr:PqqD family protein [Gemmatimonadaceae bacterium]